MNSNPLLFCGSSHTLLGQEVSSQLGIPIGQMTLEHFPDGEISVEILDNVRGRDTYILQSTALNPNNFLMELLIIIDALKRASARNIIAIIPYYGYCRQDRKDKPGEPITAKLVANMLMSAGISRLITIDLHAGQLEGFFEVPVDHLHCQTLLAETAKKSLGSQCVVVAPDIGSVKIARKMAKLINVDMAIVEKQRLSSTEVKMNLIGQVKGKNILIVDDIFSTGTTCINAAELCKKEGAQQIIAAVTHAICSGDALKKIDHSALQSLIVTDTVPVNERFINHQKIIVVSVAELLANAIRKLRSDYHVTP